MYILPRSLWTSKAQELYLTVLYLTWSPQCGQYLSFFCQMLVWSAASLFDIVMCGEPGAGLLRRMLWRLPSSVKVCPGETTVPSLDTPLQE